VVVQVVCVRQGMKKVHVLPSVAHTMFYVCSQEKRTHSRCTRGCWEETDGREIKFWRRIP